MLIELLAGQLSIYTFLIWISALLVAVTVHEFSHALVATLLGDDTAKLLGRLSLNPLSHLDPLGTLMILLVRFGWGKPVPFNPLNLENPRRDAALVSLAGPLSNILAAAVFSLPLRLGFPWGVVFVPIVFINLGLALFNLLPIHPLDGFKIVGGVLPESLAYQWATLAPYGLWLLILFVFLPGFSLLNLLVWPLMRTLLFLFLGTPAPAI